VPACPEAVNSTTCARSGALLELMRLHYRYRFDAPGLSDAEREALKHETPACLEYLNRDKP
jgi:hypothetical protein